MKPHSPLRKFSPYLVPVVAFAAAIGISETPSIARAQTSVTETTVTTITPSTPASTAEIAAQEVELQQKQMEYDKAKLDQQKSEALDLRKAQLEIDIKKLELLKARRDLLIEETKEQLAMQLQGDVLFDINSTVVKTGAKPSLKEVALILSEYPKGNVVVTGFADSTGNTQDNLELSRKRAEAVKTYLLENASTSISSERIVARGLGETKPVATNMSSAGRQLNRRVEITISKPLAN